MDKDRRAELLKFIAEQVDTHGQSQERFDTELDIKVDKFYVDEIVIMHSPYTGEDVPMSYRGSPEYGKAVVFNIENGYQMTVPVEWLRKRFIPGENVIIDNDAIAIYVSCDGGSCTVYTPEKGEFKVSANRIRKVEAK
jgi:hypothetical protein